MLTPRMTDCPELHVLTTTGRGMNDGNMQAAASQGFGELMSVLERAGLMARFQSCIALFPDEPQGKDDQQARMLCGAVFDLSLADGGGRSTRPEIELTGTLACPPAGGALRRLPARGALQRSARGLDRGLSRLAAGHRLCLARRPAVRALR